MSIDAVEVTIHMITKHILVEGKVQGVFFRDYTRQESLRNHLTGWVRNLPNGSVEAIIRGEEKNIGKILLWLEQGSPHSRVDRVIIEDFDCNEIFSTFEIHY